MIFLSAVGACGALLVWVVSVGIGFFPSFNELLPFLDDPQVSNFYDFFSYVFNFDFLITFVSSYFFILVFCVSVSISISVGFVLTSVVPVLAEHFSRWFTRMTGD